MKTRLLFLSLVVLLAVGDTRARAEQPAKVRRVGYLGLDDPSSLLFDAFRRGLRDLGYLEGQNIIIEARFAYGNDWRINQLAAEILRLQVDAIVVGSSGSLFAAKSLTKTVPIVMRYVGDPVAAGIIASPERPGGNITGIGGMAAGLGGKWLELLKETVPEIRRVGVLYSRGSEQESPMMKELGLVARSLRVELRPVEVRRLGDVSSSYTWTTLGQADGFVVLPGGSFEKNLPYIADEALKRRLPGIFWRSDFAVAGGLLAYGANQIEESRRAAYFVDKIFKGAKPSELPVERPTQFELVINLKTAKEIGVTIHPEVLMWADRVIK